MEQRQDDTASESKPANESNLRESHSANRRDKNALHEVISLFSEKLEVKGQYGQAS